MYSTSKSFTSSAIGFAVHEGLLTVEDPVISFFPDKLPDTISANLEAMKVKHLLTMSAGQDPEPTFAKLLPSDDWVKAFLAHPVPRKPGSVFLYNSAATYMLSAIITKVTGETVLDYLKPRLFDPLQITGMDWEVDPNGINVGGWGLRVKTEDMAKFGLLYLQKGKWNGEQVISEEWVEEATSMHILQHPELNDKQRSKSDWLQGYGYKFWRSRNNSYRADGAYGQYILVLPEKDAVVAITAEVDNMQEEIDLVWEYLFPGLHDEALEYEVALQEKLEERLAGLHLRVPKGQANSLMENELTGKSFIFDSEGVEETVTFQFFSRECQVEYSAGEDVSYEFKFGQEDWMLGETDRPGANLLPQPDQNYNEMLPFKVAGTYRWITDQQLELILRYIESPHAQYFMFDFAGDEVKLKMWESRPGSERTVTQTGHREPA